jgi:uncharacterized membrane protein YedE/YeeE
MPPMQLLPVAVRAVAAAGMGVVFGLALQKGRVFEPLVIRAQMHMESFIMMKMFLSAMATSAASFALLDAAAPQRMQHVRAAFHGCFATKSPRSVLLGGLVLGVGMYVGGCCPGMLLIQLGAGVSSAVYTLAGAFAGVLAFSVLAPHIVPLTAAAPAPGASQQLGAGTVSFRTGAACMAAALFAGLAALETLVPWRSELPPAAASAVLGGPLQMAAWSPIVAGVCVGLLQIPAVLLHGDTLGGSSSYCTCMSLVCGPVWRSEYLARFRGGFKWQAVYVAAAVAGGLLGQQLAAAPYAAAELAPAQAFAGGFLALFGARLAGGCTSGHGLSGTALLTKSSFLATAAMFAGGMAAAALHKFLR